MTLTTLSDRGKRMLADLPPYLAADPFVEQSQDVIARELDRLEDTMALIRSLIFPQNADDRYLTLAMWETLLGLPPQPTGVTEDARRAQVLAAIRNRNVSAGSRWVEAMTQSIGSGSWSHSESTSPPYTIVIRIPYVSGGYKPAQILAFARRITPAHLAISVGYEEGFLVEISDIETDAL